MTDATTTQRSRATQDAWARRAAWGAIAMAVLAAIVLAVTVALAKKGVSDATSTMVRGQGETLLRAVSDGLNEEPGPLNVARVESAFAKTRAEGVRYIAVIKGPKVAEAGQRSFGDPTLVRPGMVEQSEGLARVAQPLLPHPPDARRPPGPPPMGPRPAVGIDHSPFGPPPGPPLGFPPGPPPDEAERPPPTLVIEFAPLVATSTASAMRVTTYVAAVAILALLAVALVLSRFIARHAEAERRGEKERRLMALGEMSSVMAHELRNPLAALKGHAQLLEEDLAEGSAARDKARRVVAEAQRLERLMVSLRELVREGPLERTSIAPNEWIARATSGLPSERIVVRVDRAPAEVSLDVQRMSVALGNLVRNAIESAPEGPVEIDARSKDGALIVDVRDHGPGIAPGDEERIFEPFVTTRVKGTGLGLAIARRAAVQHGGSLTAENASDGGAVFRLRLPLARG